MRSWQRSFYAALVCTAACIISFLHLDAALTGGSIVELPVGGALTMGLALVSARLWWSTRRARARYMRARAKRRQAQTFQRPTRESVVINRLEAA